MSPGGGVDRTVIVLAGTGRPGGGRVQHGRGEYTSVAAQAELAEAEIAVEREELRTNAAAEERELAAMYVDRGLDPDLAAEVARRHRDPETALNVHAREELGAR